MIREVDIEVMWSVFRDLGEEGLAFSHYDLHRKFPAFSTDNWKEFLMLPDVSEWIRSEQNMLQESELRKLLSKISTSKSVGQAQLINSLTKMQDSGGTKDGPAFIYSYVPLDTEQEHAPNIRRESRDIFIV